VLLISVEAGTGLYFLLRGASREEERGVEPARASAAVVSESAKAIPREGKLPDPERRRREQERQAVREAAKRKQEAQEQARGAALAAWETRRAAVLAELAAENQRLVAEAETLDEEARAWQQVPWAALVVNPRALNVFNAFLRRASVHSGKAQALNERFTRKNNELAQAKRRILAKYPQAGDPQYVEYKGLLLTKGEKEEQEAILEIHGSPRAVADHAIRELQEKKMIPSASYAGTFTNQGDRRIVAVCYLLTGVLGRKSVTRQPVHILVYKNDSDSLWYAVDTTGTGADVHLGPPPWGYR
jgi:hypothetical protein